MKQIKDGGNKMRAGLLRDAEQGKAAMEGHIGHSDSREAVEEAVFSQFYLHVLFNRSSLFFLSFNHG